MMNRSPLYIVLFIFVAIIVLSVIIWYFLFYRVHGSYFDSDGVKIYYTVEGEGEPVILVHGFAVDADLNWRKQGVNRLLRKRYKVIALDNRGHGLSGKPHDPKAYGPEMAKDVIHLMDHLGIDKANLVGYSLGGFIALKCSVDYPERFRTITIMGSAWEDETHGRSVKALKMVEQAYREHKPLGAAMDFFEGKASSQLIKYLFVKFSNYFNDEKALAAVVQGLDSLLISEDDLKNIALPMCGIVGDKDPFYESAMHMQDMVQHYEFTTVEGGDHLSTPRKNQAKNALLNFLAKHH